MGASIHGETGVFHNPGGDFDFRNDIMAGDGSLIPNASFWNQLENDSYETGAPATTKNRSKVGAVRPSALLYTSGIGATVDLPHLSVMPHGLDAWQRYYDRRAGGAAVLLPRLDGSVQTHDGSLLPGRRRPRR